MGMVKQASARQAIKIVELRETISDRVMERIPASPGANGHAWMLEFAGMQRVVRS